MRRIIWRYLIILMMVLLMALLISCIYIGRMNYAGYCFSEGKYLTDEEKVRVAVADVLKLYPPPVIRTPVEPDVWKLSYPERPIYYRDVDEFLALNPSCCAISQVRNEHEGYRLGLLEKSSGKVTRFVDMNYAVRYFDAENKMQSIAVKGYLSISNCGKPVRWWEPLQSDLDFIYNLITH